MSDINKLRTIIKGNINDIIDNDKLSNNIEQSIYDYTINSIDDQSLFNILFESVYNQKSSEILEYFRVNKKYLLESLNNNTLNSKIFASYKPEELNPEKYSKIMNNKSYAKYKTNKGSSIFTCPKCKKSDFEVTQKQTRSGDEPPTTFAKCLVCGNVLKF